MTDRYMEAGWQGQPIDFHFVMDAHAHMGQNTDFLVIDASVEGILAVKDRLGVNLTAVNSIPGTSAGWPKGNDAVIDAVQRHPDRFLGYITINAHDPASVLPECERCWAAGCRALKLHSAQGFNYDAPELQPALEFADDKGCPILCHTWGKELDHMGPLFGRYPNSIWLLGHAGCVDREEYARVANAYPNAVLEICYSRCPKGVLEYFVDEGLEDKVLWGTDSIFFASTHQLGRVLFAKLDEAIKKKILCDNARRVFNLDS